MAVRLVSSWTTLSPVAILVTVLALNGNIQRLASIAIPLLGLPPHRHALRRLSIAGLSIHAEFLM
jgi:hypothetical protein